MFLTPGNPGNMMSVKAEILSTSVKENNRTIKKNKSSLLLPLCNKEK